jgi:hypothetical protein
LTVTGHRAAFTEAPMRVKHPFRALLRVVAQGAPLEAQLIVTRRCNLSCGYCSEYDKVSSAIPLDLLK